MSPVSVDRLDWPKCTNPACTTLVEDGGLCSRCTEYEVAKGHRHRPDPAHQAQPAWQRCIECGSRPDRHGHG